MTDRTRAAYDQIAAQYAARNAAMPPELAAAADRFLQLVGPGACILDVGCGAGRDMAWLEARKALVIGIDASCGMLALARLLVCGPLLQMDMCHLGLRQGCFQGLWCCASLLHLPKREAALALAEMHRMLVPGGQLFLSIQEGEGATWEEGPYPKTRRLFARYSRGEIQDLLTQSGFHIMACASNEAGSRSWLQFFATSKM